MARKDTLIGKRPEPEATPLRFSLGSVAAKAWLVAAFTGLLVTAACGSGENGRGILGGTNTDEHSVSLEDVHFDRFNGDTVTLAEITEEELVRLRDQIPPLDRVLCESAGEAAWLAPEDLILGFVSADGQAYAYPARILNFHEIVNEELAGEPVLITYCPLCRSGVIFDRRFGPTTLSFGNTSALYQADLVMYDRQSRSYWFQSAGEAIVGDLTGSRLTVLPSTMTSWQRWAALHPRTLVTSRLSSGSNGYFRAYESNPFAGIEEHVNRGDFPFPVTEAAKDDRLDAAELVLGVEVGESARAYPIRLLGASAFNDLLGDRDIVIFTSQDGPIAVAFEAEIQGVLLKFSERDGRFIDDQTGSTWDFSGRAVTGELAGSQLTPLPNRTTFWFSYAASFPGASVFEP